MKKALLRTLGLCSILLSFVSCVTGPMDTYPSGGYSSGGYSGPYNGNGGYYSDPYANRPYYGSMTTGYGWGGGGYGICNVCRSNPCRCGSRSTVHHHDDHCDLPQRRSSSSRSSSSRSSSSDSLWRYSGSVGRGDTKPEGNHTREWYKERGYDLSKLKKVN
jgi:hypothetical protein